MATDQIEDGVEPPTGYIRGGAGLPTEPRRILRIIAVFLTISMVVLIAALVVQAAHQNARDRELTRHGVPVTVTVTSCLGTATGTGITVKGFVCHGTFVLDGHRHTDIIRGVSTLKQRGDLVQGVTDPKSPQILSTTALVAGARPSWHAYFLAIGLTAGLLLTLLVGWLWSRRRGDRGQPTP